MSEAIKLIVNAYVGLKDRQRLEELREHRQRMRKQLQDKAGGPFDMSKYIRTCDEEIEIVERGLGTL